MSGEQRTADVEFLQSDHERPLTAASKIKETWYSYLVLAVSFATCLVVDGIQTAYGVIYQDIKSYFAADASSLTWPGAIQIFMTHFGALMTSAFLEVFGLRTTGIVGGFLSTCGLITAYFARSLVVLTLGYGLVTGAGFSFLIVLSNVSVQKYFNKNRALAAGISCAGSSIGVFAMSPLVRFLLNRYSWRGCMLITAGITLQCIWLWMLVLPKRSNTKGFSGKDRIEREITEIEYKPEFHPALPSKWNKTGNSTRKRISQKIIATLKASMDFKHLKKLRFAMYTFALFMAQLAYPIMFVFGPDKGSDMGFSKDQTKWFIFCIGIGSLFGRVTVGLFGNVSLLRGRRLYLHQFNVALAGTGLILIPVCRNLWSLFSVFVVIGYATGGHVVVLPVTLVDLFGHDVISRSFGLSLVSIGLASLIATPFAGYVRHILDSYDPVFYLAGGYFLVSFLVMFLIPFTNRRFCGK